MDYSFTNTLDEVEREFQEKLEAKHNISLNVAEMVLVTQALQDVLERCVEMFNEGDRSEELRAIGANGMTAIEAVISTLLTVEVISEKHNDLRELLELWSI